MTDEEYSALANQARTVRDLEKNPGWAMLVDYALHETSLRRRRLLSGACDTHEQYLALSNFLVGADWVLHIADELETKLENEAAKRAAEALEETLA